jgi:hypothetical protein
MDYFKLAGENLLFGLVLVTVGFVLGYVLYSALILRKINLKDSLFEKDNIAAWIEFIGAFVFPTLFLSAKAIEGAADENLWMDLLICTAYAAAYVVIFTVLRLLSGLIVSSMGRNDEQGKINLNTEVYNEQNTAASLFSVSLSIVFVTAIRFLDLTQGLISASIYRILAIIIFTLASVIVYCLGMGRKTSLFEEIFIHNNPAAGISLAGFIFAVELLLTNAVALQVEFDLIDIVVTSGIWLILLGILSFIFKAAFTRLIKVDIRKEVYDHNSIGAAIGQCALYIGIANVLISFVK